MRKSSPIALVIYTLLLYVSGVFSFLTPLPLVYTYLAHGRAVFVRCAGLILLCLVPLYVAALDTSFEMLLPHLFWYGNASFAVITGIAQYFLFASIAALLGRAQECAWSLSSLLGRGALLFAVVVLTLAVGSEVVQHQSLLTPIREGLNQFVGELISAGQKQGSDFVLTDKLKTELVDTILHLLFATSFVWMLGVALFNLMMAKRIFKDTFVSLGDFSQWKMPFYAVWVTIAGIAVGLAKFYIPPAWASQPEWNLLLDIALNLLVILATLYFIQGLAIVAFYLKKWNVGSLGQLGLYLAIVILLQVLGIVVVMLGFFDAWLNVRRMMPAKN